MTRFARELLCEVVQEVQPLLVAHHEEIYQGRMPLDPRWRDYALLESLGRYAVFTARDEGRLVAYSAYYVDRHMHSAGFTFARNDVFYVSPEKRGAMVLGFLRHCHRELKAEGARHIGYLCPDNNLMPILNCLRFKPEETFMGLSI